MSKSLAWIGTRAATSLFLASSPCARNPISSGLGSLYLRRPASPLVLKCSMSDTPKTAVDFRVVTYNILCSHLAEPTRFPLCDPENLDAPTRLIRVKQKLDTEVSARSPRLRPKLRLTLLSAPSAKIWGSRKMLPVLTTATAVYILLLAGTYAHRQVHSMAG